MHNKMAVKFKVLRCRFFGMGGIMLSALAV
jgi:hypothetical protein